MSRSDKLVMICSQVYGPLTLNGLDLSWKFDMPGSAKYVRQIERHDVGLCDGSTRSVIAEEIQ